LRAILLGLLLAVSVGANAAALEVNTATRAQLEQLNGLGVTMTERVLGERAKAPFRSWDDLRSRVKGIGLKRAQQLEAQGLTVNGMPLTPAPEPAR
jgi:competence protein ComEA